jgi:hypothetical protein
MNEFVPIIAVVVGGVIIPIILNIIFDKMGWFK